MSRLEPSWRNADTEIVVNLSPGTVRSVHGRKVKHAEDDRLALQSIAELSKEKLEKWAGEERSVTKSIFSFVVFEPQHKHDYCVHNSVKSLYHNFSSPQGFLQGRAPGCGFRV